MTRPDHEVAEPSGIEAGCFGGYQITDERAFIDWAFYMRDAAVSARAERDGLRQQLAAAKEIVEHVQGLVDHADDFIGEYVHVDALRDALAAAVPVQPAPGVVYDVETDEQVQPQPQETP